MRFTSFALSLVLALTVLNCSKKNELAGPHAGEEAPQGKNPPGVPDLPKRELIADVLNYGNILGTTACAQLVKLNEPGLEGKMYLDLSNEACPAGLIDEAKVLTRLEVVQHPQYFTQFRPIDIGTGEYIGVIRKVDLDTKGYRLEGLCDKQSYDWSAEDWSQTCNLGLDGNKLSSSEPIIWYPD